MYTFSALADRDKWLDLRNWGTLHTFRDTYFANVIATTRGIEQDGYRGSHIVFIVSIEARQSL
jgi:hypothetical protein